MKMKLVVNAQNHIMLKKGFEEPWTNERVARFMDLLSCRENTLKSDARLADMFQAVVTTEDAVTGDRPSNGLIENAVMLIRGIFRTIKCQIEGSSDESFILPWLVEHAGCILSRCQSSRDGETPFEKHCMARNRHNNLPHVVRKCWQSKSPHPMNRMNPRYKFGILLGMRSNSAECSIGNADVVF